MKKKISNKELSELMLVAIKLNIQAEINQPIILEHYHNLVSSEGKVHPDHKNWLESEIRALETMMEQEKTTA